MSDSMDIQAYDNPQPRCPCVLLLDTSASMKGEPIQALNRGVRLFFDGVVKDDFARFSVEASIITFGNCVKQVTPFTSYAASTDVRTPPLTAQGGTYIGGAMEMGLAVLAQRKAGYEAAGISSYQPWMVLVTDGKPGDNWWPPAQEVASLSRQGKLVFIGVAVGDKVDMNQLGRICPPEQPPQRLDGLAFEQFFCWLSQSMSCVSRSAVCDQIALPSIDGWAAI